jgi:hypothetical protein
MSHLRVLLLILCCFLFFVTNISFGQDKSGIKKARVIESEAIIYADPTLKTPIGKASKNTQLYIGRPLEKNPEIAPIVVSGRIAYIQIANLYIDDKTKSDAHDPNYIYKDPTENFFENNSAYFAIHQMSIGSQINEMFQTVDGVNATSMTGLSAAYLHHQSASPYLWGLGCEYYSATSPNINFNYLMINPTVGVTAFKKMLLSMDLIFSYDFSVNARLDIENNSYLEKMNLIYGPNFGARIIFFPLMKYHLTSSLTYRLYNISADSKYYDTKDVAHSGLTSLDGLNFSIGFSINI